MKTLTALMETLPPERRAKILARADDLVLQESTLRAAREGKKATQEDVARKLGIGQDRVSRLEKRGDMLVSTLRDYVAAIGGRIRLVVEFEGKPSVELRKLGVARRKAATRQARRGKVA